MILDSSALVAILRSEPDALDLAEAARSAASLSMGASTLLETSIVIGPDRQPELGALLEGLRVSVVAFDVEHARVAREAYLRYGRNSGSRARLNYGDVMSYAVAKVAGEPLLFKGDDFTHTDIERAL